MARSAVCVVDMLNSYGHPDAERLRASAEKALPRIARLVERAADADVLTVYVNDNFGAWTSNRDDFVRELLAGEHARLVEPIAPRSDALFVFKTRHSIFYGTPLEELLRQEGVDRVVLAGQVTEQCILYSALDAYIRHFDVAVAADATAAIHDDLADAALKMMDVNMSAEIASAEEVSLA